MQEQELIHLSASQRAAIGALGDSGISSWTPPGEAVFGRVTEPGPTTWHARVSGSEKSRRGALGDGGGPTRRRAHRAWSSLRIGVVFADLLILLATPIICHILYLGTAVWDRPGLAFIQLGCVLVLCGLQVTGAYTRAAMQRPSLVWNSFVLTQAGAVIGVMGFGFVSREFDNLSRVWVVLSWTVTAGLLFALHLAVTALVVRIMKAGHLRERVAIVCTGARARMALEKFQAAAAPEVLIVGIFDDRKDRIPEDFEGYEVRGDTSNLLSYIRSHAIDRVIVTIPWSAEQRITELVEKLRQAPVRVDLIPHKLIWELPSDVHRIHGVPIVTVANHRVDAQMDVLKRAEDLVLGSLISLVVAPIMLAVAIAIRLDSPGPILFRQKRFGFNNEVIEVYKFRSMYANRPADAGEQQATKSDPRVTRVGRFIRRTSLDELPQLLHVLLGEMSLVGPRPHAVPHNDHYGALVAGYFARHNVKPGITGWAQVNGHRGETDTIEKMSCRVRYDLEYIERWSLLLDIKIVFLTAFRIWFQDTAY